MFIVAEYAALSLWENFWWGLIYFDQFMWIHLAISECRVLIFFVTVTLTPGLSSRKTMSGPYLLYYLR